MIYVRDKGQMCNNILQFAHVWAFAREHGRRALSMRFAYKYQYFSICKTPGHNFFRYAVAKFAASRGLMPVVSYDDPGVRDESKERKMLDSANVMVQGWEVRFYDLFLKYFDEIRSMFAFLPEVEAAVSPLVGRGEGSLRLGLHVRRGDYARWQGGRYFFSDRQYAEVAARYTSTVSGRRITLYVCSNDPSLDRDEYRRALPDAEIIFAQGNPGEDLCLLSRCDVLIGAPSTFSLVASMYRELPLYWIEDPDAPVSDKSFSTFRDLFRRIK